MLKLKMLLSLCLFFLGFKSSIGCGNEYYRKDIPFNENKIVLESLLLHSEYTPYWQHGFGEELYTYRDSLLNIIRSKGVKTADDYKITWPELNDALQKVDYRTLSDFAWYELRLYSKQNAVKLLEALYEKHPNEYNILANLGTAYEVIGKNAEALRFLKKAVEINPGSHYGSEWIHLRILEEKINPSPDYSKILALGADNNYSLWLSGASYNKPIKPDSLMVQLAYQLHERISFIEEPDPIVGRLVLDFADLVAITNSRKEAVQFYDYAVKYHPALKSLVAERIQSPSPENISGKPNSTNPKKTGMNLVFIGIGVLLLIIIFFVVKKRK